MYSKIDLIKQVIPPSTSQTSTQDATQIERDSKTSRFTDLFMSESVRSEPFSNSNSRTAYWNRFGSSGLPVKPSMTQRSVMSKPAIPSLGSNLGSLKMQMPGEGPSNGPPLGMNKLNLAGIGLTTHEELMQQSA